MAALSAATFCALELTLYLQGLMDANAVLQNGVLAVVASGCFYVVFRTGLNQRAADPSLTAPMMSVAVAILLYTMAISPTAYQTFGIFIGMIMLFRVFRYSGRELLLCALVFLIAYGAMIALTWNRVPRLSESHEMDVARWLAVASALPIFAWVGGHINKFRRRMDERKLFYQTIWDACSDVVVVVDGEGLVHYVNPAASAVFGLGPADLIGFPLSRLQPPEQAHGSGALLEDALRPRPGGRSETVEVLGWHRDGRPFPVEATFTTVVLDGARVVVGFLRDITARKATEQRIHHMAGTTR